MSDEPFGNPAFIRYVMISQVGDTVMWCNRVRGPYGGNDL
jgi:hypothetical protein